LKSGPFERKSGCDKTGVEGLALGPHTVKVSYSPKRKRTVSARLEGGVLSVVAPSTITRHRLEKAVDELKGRIVRRKIKERIKKDRSLEDVFRELNAKYFENKLKVRSISYSSGQKKRYGCCDHVAGNIRISSRLKEMPDWVRNYVIVHEMAHLLEPDHGKTFHKLVSRYKLAERARGYLMAAGVYGANVE
jgi:predicted metal-dependent hydrolase